MVKIPNPPIRPWHDRIRVRTPTLALALGKAHASSSEVLGNALAYEGARGCWQPSGIGTSIESISCLRDSDTRQFSLFYHLQYEIIFSQCTLMVLQFFFCLVILIHIYILNPHLAKCFIICSCFTEHTLELSLNPLRQFHTCSLNTLENEK